MIIPKRIKIALRLATEILPKLPARGDSILQLIAKSLSMVDSAQNVLSPGKANALDQLVEKYDLSEAKNEQFVSLFFDTDLHKQFEIHRYSLTDNLDAIEAVSGSFGRLYFLEYSAQRPQDTFYHTKGFNFTEVLQGVWDVYEGRLHVTISHGNFGNGTASQFATFHAPANPLYGALAGTMNRLVARHRRWLLDEEPRSYMFYGTPGTGKTSFALAFAEQLGHRTLKIDAGSLAYASVRDITFLMDALAPDFLLIDDVDKVEMHGTMPTLLDILQRFKTESVKTSVLLTANTTALFDPGLLRPGRIDTWVEFPNPDAAERREILTRYIAELKTPGIGEELIATLVEATDTLTQDYVREVAHLLSKEEPEEVIRTVSLMRKLLEENAKTEKPAFTSPGNPMETKSCTPTPSVVR